MCGRTGLGLSRETLRCACSFKPKGADNFMRPDWLDEHYGGKSYSPSYNIAPTDVTPVLVSSSKFKSGQARALKPMMWGIIPPWHKGDYKNHNLSTNNCRLEGIKSSKLYGPALENGGRCIIVVEGFYEWQTTIKSKTKQPYYIYAPQDEHIQIDNEETWNNSYSDEGGWKGISLLHLAGIYSVWQNADTIIYSYSVITMESNGTLNWLHQRMPAVLQSQEQIDAWLDIDNVNSNMALSYLTPVKMLSWHPVSSQVNNSRTKSNNLNKRIKLENKGSQKTLTSWFTKGEKRKSNEEPKTESKRIKKET